MANLSTSLAENNSLLSLDKHTVKLSTIVSSLEGVSSTKEPLTKVLTNSLSKAQEFHEILCKNPKDLQTIEKLESLKWYTRRVLYNTALYLTEQPSCLGLPENTGKEGINSFCRYTMWTDPKFTQKLDSIPKYIFEKPLNVRKSAPI